MKKIRMTLSEESIDSAIQELEDYAKSLDQKAQELCKRLADMGALYAEWNFSGVLYAGEIDYKISVDKIDDHSYMIRANGESVLFMEFGAGVRYGYGHPKAAELGMGPGTYNPSSDTWKSPSGWWFPQGGTTIHTYGNAPGMPMYNAAKDLQREILEVAREVFSS